MKRYFQYIIEWITPEKRREAEHMGYIPTKERLKNQTKPALPEWVPTYLMQFHAKKGSTYKEILPVFKDNFQDKIKFNSPIKEEARYILTEKEYVGVPANRAIHDDILIYLRLTHRLTFSEREFISWNKFNFFNESCCSFPFIAAHILKDKLYISESYSDACAKEISENIKKEDWKFYKTFHKLMLDTNTTYRGKR